MSKIGIRIRYLLLFLVFIAVPSYAVVVDFSVLPATPGNQGASVTLGDLTITAKSGLLATDDPIFASAPGTVFWGNLGGLDSTDCPGGMTACNGLGVQNDGDSMMGPGGSAGISGAGPDAFEAAVFSFANPLGVDAGSVQLTLIGLNTGGMNADTIELV